MTAAPISIADELSRLVEKRRLKQISEHEFETKKRVVLGQPPAGLSPIIRNLLACLILNVIVLGLAIIFTAYARLIVLAMLLMAGMFVIGGGSILAREADRTDPNRKRTARDVFRHISRWRPK